MHIFKVDILCEIYYAKGKNKEFQTVKKLLKTYNLPTDLKAYIKKKSFKKMKKEIYKNIFLDKKTISKYPRYIKVSKIGKTKVAEMKNFALIRKTINEVIFSL